MTRAEMSPADYAMDFFLAAGSPHTIAAIRNLKEILKRLPAGRLEVTLVDVAAEPEAAEAAGALATPALLRRTPAPEIWIIGTLADHEAVLRALAGPGGAPGSAGGGAGRRDPEEVSARIRRWAARRAPR